MKLPGVNDAAVEAWERVVEDLEATAAEYRDDGWEVVELHPGDVTPLPPDHERFGLDVLVPGDEYETVSAMVTDTGAAFDEFEVFRAVHAGHVFLVVAVEDGSREQVLLVPVYYGIKDAKETTEGVLERDTFPVHIRPLTIEDVVTVEPSEPELLLPPTE
ncbi:DUF7529 family protein [Haloarchaeobius salinus]|uniref:DUF7529 family protein n=1 Tax=Haloarchaeobius salinus TaxID=1198298 RepID=UPI00210C4550|nr:hypothetical protein [Haloarchaeobius salinus]